MKEQRLTLRNTTRSAALIAAVLLMAGGLNLPCTYATAQEPGQAPPAMANGNAPNSGPEGPPPPAPYPRQEPNRAAPGMSQGAPPPPPPQAGAPDKLRDQRSWDEGRGPQGPERRMFDRGFDAPDGPPPPPPQAGAANMPRGSRPGEEAREPRGPESRPFDRRFAGPEGSPLPPGPGYDGCDPWACLHARAMDPVRLFKDVDANGDGVITWKEFMEFHARMRPPEGPGQSRCEGSENRSMRRGFDGPAGPPPPPSDRPCGPRPGAEIRGPAGPERDRPDGPGREPQSFQDRPMAGPR